MSRGRLTHVATECGHEFRTGYRADEMRNCTMDCRGCGQLLIFPRSISGTSVRALLFHREMNRQDPRWPADGNGTFYSEITV